MDALRSEKTPFIFLKFIQSLISKKILDPKREMIPDQTVLEGVVAKDNPLPRSVLAVVQAYTKMWLYNKLLESSLLKDRFFNDLYKDYFPETFRKSYHVYFDQHHLKNEILATQLTNLIVNQTGITFFYEVKEITGKKTEDIVFMYMFLNTCFKGDNFREAIKSHQIKKQDKYLALIEFELMLKRITIDLLQLPDFEQNFSRVDTYVDLILLFKKVLAKNKEFGKRRDLWLGRGVQQSLAQELAMFTEFGIIPDMFYLYKKEKLSDQRIIQLVLELNHDFSFDWMKEKIRRLDLKNKWDLNQRDQLLQDIRLQRIFLVKYILSHYKKKEISKLNSSDVIEQLTISFKGPMKDYFQTISQLKTRATVNLTSLSVAIHRMNFLYYSKDMQDISL